MKPILRVPFLQHVLHGGPGGLMVVQQHGV
jgi:hypothetical protein